ncbi:thioesterase II family protein [Amycolatopsis sp. NPDC058340]|uniref:thioesterase II family protein n=1 Tax=Amycolatopsis sp. NPDC058340 TaxID=3346453 RepID=UPI0036580A6B
MTSPVRPRKWLLRKPGDDAPSRLFCFPYSGLGASMYNRWPDRVGQAEVCRIQLPGRENRVREEHYGTYEALAERLVEALEPHLDRPFGFFGHCGGALPAFATALALSRGGLPAPDRLFLSSQVAPHHGPYGRYLSLSTAELAVELEGFVRALGGEPNADLIELGLTVMRSDLAANRAYRLEKPVVLPSFVHAIGWGEDREIRPGQMGGWAEYARPGRYRHVVFPGGHHTFLHAPEPLMTELATAMDQALAPGARPIASERTGR